MVIFFDIIFVDYIAWKGRYCAFEYSSFESFLRYAFAQVLGKNPPIHDPFDTKVTSESLGNLYIVCTISFIILKFDFFTYYYY